MSSRFEVTGSPLSDPEQLEAVQRALGELAGDFGLTVELIHADEPKEETWSHHPLGLHRSDFDRLVDSPIGQAHGFRQGTATRAYGILMRRISKHNGVTTTEEGNLISRRVIMGALGEQESIPQLGALTASFMEVLLASTYPAEEES